MPAKKRKTKVKAYRRSAGRVKQFFRKLKNGTRVRIKPTRRVATRVKTHVQSHKGAGKLVRTASGKYSYRGLDNVVGKTVRLVQS